VQQFFVVCRRRIERGQNKPRFVFPMGEGVCSCELSAVTYSRTPYDTAFLTCLLAVGLVASSSFSATRSSPPLCRTFHQWQVDRNQSVGRVAQRIPGDTCVFFFVFFLVVLLAAEGLSLRIYFDRIKCPRSL